MRSLPSNQGVRARLRALVARAVPWRSPPRRDQPLTTPGVYVEEVPAGAREIRAAETGVTGFLGVTNSGPVDQATFVQSVAAFEQAFGPSLEMGMLGISIRLFFENGGRDAWVVRVAGGTPGEPPTADQVEGHRPARTGLYAFEGADALNLLCIPPFDPVADPPRRLWDAASAYCRERRALLLVDPPTTWSHAAAVTPEAVREVVTPTADAALYFPRILVADPVDPALRVTVAPSGALAGLMARTDRERGVWKAPAGMEATLRGTEALSVSLSDLENGPLNQEGVNAIRAFPGTGVVAWGARTLLGADRFGSEWKYLSVRRTALFIEESVRRGTEWVVFEPNAEPLWVQLRATVDSFLHELFRAGAFAGSTQRDAYFVSCGRDTMTQHDIESGIVNLVVGVAPLKPAELVVIHIGLTAAPP